MEGVLAFAIGVVIGTSLGLIVVGFIAVGSFDRGWDAALRSRTSFALRH